MIPKWYTWNKRNRKTFLIMLSNSVAPIKIKFTENVAINYALGMSVSEDGRQFKTLSFFLIDL
jgi:hypothetical protein